MFSSMVVWCNGDIISSEILFNFAKYVTRPSGSEAATAPSRWDDARNQRQRVVDNEMKN